MNDLINLLQTLALVLTLSIVVFTLCWIVYAFRKFVALFNKLIEEMEKPQVHTQTSTVSAVPPAPPAPVVVAEDLPAIGVRYPCHRCKAKLPVEPTHSVIKDEIALLVFKCKRCGKETEVDPSTAMPVSENK